MADKHKDFSGCLYFSSNALSRLLSKMADEAFRSIGLAPSYAFLLMSVNERPGIQPGELSEELRLTPSTITRLVEKMEYRGYLQRVSKGRATHIHPAQQSLELDEHIQEAWDMLNERYAKLLGSRYSEVLTEMTHTAVQRLEED